MVYTTKESLILENKWVSIAVSLLDAKVQRITDKVTGRDICGELVSFFALVGEDKQTEILPRGLSLAGDVVTVQTDLGNFSLRIQAEAEWFTFELLTALPKGAYKARLAHAKYDWDLQDSKVCCAVGVALTYWANPCFYPDAKIKETMAEVTAHLKDVGAKYALVIAPHDCHRSILKEVCLTIDKRYGIVTPHGGVWSRESALNMGNSFIVIEDAGEDFVLSRVEFFKKLGVDQLDFHKGPTVFCQGDFAYADYRDDADFKARISDVLEQNGMTAGLHTYASYLDYSCSLVADPKWQKDLSVLAEFTLAQNVSETDGFLPTEESTEGVSDDFGFFSRNTPYLLVGQEVIEFENAAGGFRIKQRGVAGSRIAKHWKGERICHLDGYYHGFSPVMGSELFFQIARNTAKTFCAGGFKTIYLDALDGITKHCDAKNEAWYYMAAFVTEVINHCAYPPMLEYSTICPALWAGRGRFGALDTPRRGYKCWNLCHAENNKVYLDRYGTATLGWYQFYPVEEEDLGNEHAKYHHTDAVHHLGSLAVMYDNNMVFTETPMEQFDGCPALQRNIAIYRQYDTLRKQRYFSEAVLEAIRSGKYEYHLAEPEPGRFVFEEKDYQVRKLYDLNSGERNTARISNPFGEQTPFVRIEALLSCGEGDSVTVLPLEKSKPVEQYLGEHLLEQELDLTGLRAKKVSICGNGKPGSAVAIMLRCRKGGERARLEYFIDTDFTGWRDFVLIESDNGERPDLPFDGMRDENGKYHATLAVYRSPYFHDSTARVQIDATKAAEGVKLSSVTACSHASAVLEEPSLQIGHTQVVFHCHLRSTDFIEFDGKCAKMIDRYGNEREVPFSGELIAPTGDFTARVTTKNREDHALRAQLTLGFTGKQIR